MRSPKAAEDTGCIPTDGTDYTGNASTTESGRTCQMWSVNTPHKHRYNDVGEHNYCRSPIGNKVFCFTTDPAKITEYCDVPLCFKQSLEEIGCFPTDGTTYIGKANTTEMGLSCQMWSDSPEAYGLTWVGEHNNCRDPIAGFGLFCFTGMRPARCDVPLCVSPPQSEEEIGCQPTNGTAYTGQANTTLSGRTCQLWSANTPHDSFHPEVGDHNYCRSPDDDDKLWCYTTDPKKGWEFCNVPLCNTTVKLPQTVDKVDCIPNDGTAYNGHVNTTVSGRTCQMWSVNTPNEHKFNDFGEHNYCRDTVGTGPQCYTTDPRKEWEYCYVPQCDYKGIGLITDKSGSAKATTRQN